jgi:ER lumen protein retaining receptor
MLLLLWRTIEDHDTLFVLAELSHFAGIAVLVYKIHTRKSVAGTRHEREFGKFRWAWRNGR